MAERKKIVLLGATGSIGDSTLQVISKHSDTLELVGIAAQQNVEKLASIAETFGVAHVALFDEGASRRAREENAFGEQTTLHATGTEGLSELATLPECDLVLVAVVGTQGLFPALAAIEAGKTLAIASKEILVLAGKFIMAAGQKFGSEILPIDSEHSAIFQCLQGEKIKNVDKLILTASGGSFRDLPLEQFKDVTVEEALKHPNWDMGPKVTLDTATMANKGLEMIEARWLFGMRPEQVQVTVHPQSIVHSMVQYIDGSIIAQLSPPHMAFAIQHSLLYPERSEGVVETLDFSHSFSLDFRSPDMKRYPCLGLARSAMEACGVAPGTFNAANEIAVESFVNGRIHFTDIARVIDKTLERIDNIEPSSIEEVLEYDQHARSLSSQIITSI